jgi:hypothetical protein
MVSLTGVVHRVIQSDSMTKHTRQVLLNALKVVILCLTLFLLWTGNSWAQVATDSKIAPLIEKLIDNDAHIRTIAADALVNMGSSAVPSLIEALKNQDSNLRWQAASVLGDLGAEAAPAVPALSAALHDEDGTSPPLRHLSFRKYWYSSKSSSSILDGGITRQGAIRSHLCSFCT